MADITDFYEFDTCSVIDQVKKAELDAVDYDAIVYETSKYQVVPTITLTLAGEPVVKYGIFNKETGVCEAEASQLITAKGWATSLTETLLDPNHNGIRDDLPGLGSGDGTPTLN